jgi:cytochrome bd-type quinol oxidase subunit 1
MNHLLITTQIAGILLLSATMVLLFFRRIYLDSQTRKPIAVSLPLFGKVSTQAPVLVLVMIGAVMVAYPLSKNPVDMTSLEGDLDTGGKPVSVVIVAVPHYQYNQDASGHFSYKIPLLATDTTYRAKFLVDKQVIDDQELTFKDGRFKFNPLRWIPPVDGSLLNEVPIKKDVSDEELKKILSTAK